MIMTGEPLRKFCESLPNSVLEELLRRRGIFLSNSNRDKLIETITYLFLSPKEYDFLYERQSQSSSDSTEMGKIKQIGANPHRVFH